MGLTTKAHVTVTVGAIAVALVALLAASGCAKSEPASVGSINAPESAVTSDAASSENAVSSEGEAASSESSELEEPSSAAVEPGQPNGDRGSVPANRDVGVASETERKEIQRLADNAALTWPNTTSLEPLTDVPSTDAALNGEVASHLVESVSKLTSLGQQGQIAGGPLEEIMVSDFYSNTTVATSIHNFGHDSQWYLDPADVHVYENGSLDEGVVKVAFTMRDTATNSEQWTFDGYCDTKFWMFKLIGQSNPENVGGEDAQ